MVAGGRSVEKSLHTRTRPNGFRRRLGKRDGASRTRARDRSQSASSAMPLRKCCQIGNSGGGGNRTRATFRSTEADESSASTQAGAHLLEAGAPGSSRDDAGQPDCGLECKDASQRVLASHAQLDGCWLDAVARDDELDERRAGQARAERLHLGTRAQERCEVIHGLAVVGDQALQVEHARALLDLPVLARRVVDHEERPRLFVLDDGVAELPKLARVVPCCRNHGPPKTARPRTA